MREIKFRAWIHDAPHKMENMFYQENQYLASFIRRIHMYYGVKDHASYLPFQLEERLMQYTGLKDKNGKEIYEGDVVTDNSIVDEYGCVHKAEVIFDKGAFRYGNTNCQCGNCDATRLFDEYLSLEVIGNIHEHPDLLK